MKTNKKTFCENCLDYVEYKIVDEQKEGTIKNEKVKYLAQVAYCLDCGAEVYISGIDDENVKRCLNAYCKKHDLITQDEIEEILSKYKISDRNLAKILNMGEITIARYRRGYLPTKPYSELLLKILDDENYFYNLLESNKNKISEKVYKKCVKNKKDTEYINSYQINTSFEFSYQVAISAA